MLPMQLLHDYVHGQQGLWPTSKLLVFTLAELKKIWEAGKENSETPEIENASNCKYPDVI